MRAHDLLLEGQPMGTGLSVTVSRVSCGLALLGHNLLHERGTVRRVLIGLIVR